MFDVFLDLGNWSILEPIWTHKGVPRNACKAWCQDSRPCGARCGRGGDRQQIRQPTGIGHRLRGSWTSLGRDRETVTLSLKHGKTGCCSGENPSVAWGWCSLFFTPCWDDSSTDLETLAASLVTSIQAAQSIWKTHLKSLEVKFLNAITTTTTRPYFWSFAYFCTTSIPLVPWAELPGKPGDWDCPWAAASKVSWTSP